MFKRLTLAVLVMLLVGCVGLSWHSEVPPIGAPPSSSFPAAQVALGGQLAGAGGCAGCHTAAGGLAYGGGVGLETGFGTIYSTNISPDVQTGIGSWSLAAFDRALRQGVARDGTHLFPAFPYTHFTLLSDGDVGALYAYFMTRDPVSSPSRANRIPFPLNVRSLQAGWKLLFFKPGVYRADARRGEAWNRGAYLAEGIAHCAACHTPRNRFGAERSDAPYAGAPLDGWVAPTLSAASPAPVPWSQQDLYDYLRNGESERHGVAAGAMAAVVHQGLARLPDSDIQALATYFSDLGGAAGREPQAAAALALAQTRRLADVGQETDPAANLYLAGCAYCHYSAAPGPGKVSGSLALSTALTADDPANFIQTVLHGVGGAGTPGPYMPAFAGALTDADIALLAAYLRRTRSDRPAWPNLLPTVTAHRPMAAVPP